MIAAATGKLIIIFVASQTIPSARLNDPRWQGIEGPLRKPRPRDRQ
jgi:hypothetical protein